MRVAMQGIARGTMTFGRRIPISLNGVFTIGP